MLKKQIWELLTAMTGRNFRREYKGGLRIDFRLMLRDLLLHAYINVPYYHDIFTEKGLVVDGEKCVIKHTNIPILTKEIIRNRWGDLISRNRSSWRWFCNSSSGSTGEPLKFIQDRQFSKWRMCTHKYYYENMLGIDDHSRKVVLGVPSYTFTTGFGQSERIASRVEAFLTNTVALDVSFMTIADMEHYIRIINSYKPERIVGYANALYEISRFAEKKGMEIHTPKLVLSTAEVLHEDMREKIESVFGGKVYNYYGSRETGGIAGECGYGLLHVFTFNNAVEVVNCELNQTNEGETGKIIVTNLHNHSMPFIRYDIGDMAVQGPEKCRCGNPLPTLRKIKGRTCCFFRREDGTLVDDGYFMGIFAQKEWIKAFRIVQEDYRKIRISIAMRQGKLRKDERRDIERKIRLAMGQNCNIKWNIMDEMPRTNGKYLHTQSLVD